MRNATTTATQKAYADFASKLDANNPMGLSLIRHSQKRIAQLREIDGKLKAGK